MGMSRKKSGSSRTVSDPDGRTWTISVERYRRREQGERLDDEKSVDEIFNRLPVIFWLIKPVARVVMPYVDATVGGQPWIVASADDPPVRMVWRIVRATGRHTVIETVDEIASALARGNARPAPVAAKWIGLEQDGAVVQPESPR